MTTSGEGVRVRRTRKLLREALVDLIEERGFDALTVREIAERAMISRAAFYRHYRDKFDLVEQIFAEAMRELSDALSEPETVHSPRTWVRFFEHIAAYDRLYGALLGRKGSPWFGTTMRASLSELVREFGRLPLTDVPVYPADDDFVPNLLAAMCVEAISWWLEHGRPYSPEEMADRCMRLTGAFLRETMMW